MTTSSHTLPGGVGANAPSVPPKAGSSPGPPRYFTPSPHPPGMRSGHSPMRSSSPISSSLYAPPSLSSAPATSSMGSKIPLVQFIVESGPKSILKEYFPSIISSHYGNTIKEADIAQVLGMMAATQAQLSLSQRASKLQITAPGGSPISTAHTSTSSLSSNSLIEGWNWTDFVDVILEIFPYLNWTAIIGCLDYPEFYLQDVKGVELIVRTFYYATRISGTPLEFPCYLFIQKVWGNSPGQLSFLRYALMATPELAVFSELIKTAGRRLLSLEDIEMVGSGTQSQLSTSGAASTSPSSASAAASSASTSASTRNALLHLFHQPWNAVDLLELTVHLLDVPPCYEDARAMLELAAKQAPELLCLGLAHLRVAWATPVGDLLAKLTGGFLVGQPGASIVLPRLWRISPSVILGVMGEMHRRDPSCVSRLLDIAQDLKALPHVLSEARSHTFTIDLAALASRREHLNLDKWLQEVVRDRKEPFLRALVEYVYEHLTSGAAPAITLGEALPRRSPIPPSSEALSLMLKTLAASVPLMSSECAERWTQLTQRFSPAVGRSMPQQSETTCAQSHGLALATAPGGGPIATLSGTAHSQATTPAPSHCSSQVTAYFEMAAFQPDVEAEANACYERIYAQEASVQDVLETMIRLRGSRDPRDGMVFSCMVHNLLDEFRFFSKYPEKELALTGVIFGQLLHAQGLLDGPPLFIGVRMIAEALLCWPPESKLWRFGMTALAQCVPDAATRWPSFCRMLIRGVTGLATFPTIYERLRQGTLVDDCSEDAALVPFLEGLPAAGFGPQATFVSSFISLGERASRSLNAELGRLPAGVRRWLLCESEDEEVPLPAERLLFLVNNVVSSNVTEKAREIAALLQEQGKEESLVGSWLARYLVLKRIGGEPNQHLVYLRLVLSVEQLRAQATICLLHWTLLVAVCQARMLIVALSGMSVAGDEMLLRNLGAWIGLVTLGLQRPLLHSYIPVVELILEAHDMDRLPLVLPFICRVIEGLARAPTPQVLLPRNPWLMRVLGLLVDLYSEGERVLRLNLRFEIEGLFRTLNLLRENAVAPALPMAVEAAKLLGMPRRSLDIWRGSGSSPAAELVTGCTATTSGTSSASITSSLSSSSSSSSIPPSTSSYTSVKRASMDAAVLAAAAALNLSSTIGRPFLSALGEALSILHTPAGGERKATALQLEVAAPGAPGLLGVLLLSWEAAVRTVITRDVLLRMATVGIVTATSLTMDPSISGPASAPIPNGSSTSMSLPSFAAGRMGRSLAAHLAGATLREPIAAALVRFVESFAAVVEETSGIDVLMILSSSEQPLLAEIIERMAVVGAALAAHNSALTASSVSNIDNSAGGARGQAANAANLSAVLEAFGGWNGGVLPETGTLLAPFEHGDRVRIGAMLGMAHGAIPPTLQISDQEPRKPTSPDGIGSHTPSEIALGEFDGLVAQICELASERPARSESGPPSAGGAPVQEHASLRTLMKQVLVLALHAPQRDETCAAFAERLWALLLHSPNLEMGSTLASTRCSALVLLLDKLCELSSRVARQVSDWVLALATNVRHTESLPPIPVLIAILESGIGSLLAFDCALGAALTSLKATHIDSGLATESGPTSGSTLGTYSDSSSWALALIKASARARGTTPAPFSPWDWEATLQAATSGGMHPVDAEWRREAITQATDATAELRLVSLLEEWARLCDAVSSSDKTLCSFANQAVVRGYFRVPALFEFFWQRALGWAWCGTVERGRSPRTVALARLLLFVVRMWPHGEDKNMHLTGDGQFANGIGLHINESSTTDGVHANAATGSTFAPDSLLGMGRTELLARFWAALCRSIASGGSLARTLAELLGALLVEWHGAERQLGDATLSAAFFDLFAQGMHMCRPTLYPGLAFAWLDMLSHRVLLPRLILANGGISNVGCRVSSDAPLVLLLDALAFWSTLVGASLNSSGATICIGTCVTSGPSSDLLSSGLSSSEVSAAALRFNEGLLRLFVVLLHDFPEFLAQRHWRLVAAMPGAAWQLRNLVLSAFPRNLKLLDPFSPVLNIEALVTDSLQHHTTTLEPSLAQLAGLLTSPVPPSPRTLLDEALEHGRISANAATLLLQPPATIPRPVWINLVVFYIVAHGHDLDRCHGSIDGSRAAMLLTALLAATASMSTINEDEGRYLVVSAVANQLRYPNPHTLFCALLIRNWFSANNLVAARETIARVLLERLVVQRPHPWGLLITFVDLIRTPACRFWQQPFARGSPDIERLFESVARSCCSQELSP
ncbi:hypothetical protein DI09_22p140 [Mitosporidium daphniae]|uniref:Uncharacterized protein n=1 Tax=Mitosporidium daphniae TaxID=1485682 RepID=A0A098VT58_9MICR|nr:uncharacterized protein DI09_22p140 [Mitosporidium daphniae]KGG51989.1 hypothetical protein DI09_22p140 [Mitosporidium daphniae]|eukprot:XP_013238416.1 uncharacterized protein DI09_22p140 [Mitosporidium daphniae]